MMDIAQQIVTQVAQGDFAAVERRLADRIKPFLPVGTIRATWQGLEQQFGAFSGAGKNVCRADTRWLGAGSHLRL